MTTNRIKRLQLITITLFVLTILIMSIGLILIALTDDHDYVVVTNNAWLIIEKASGFSLLKNVSINYLLTTSANYVCLSNGNYDSYSDWVQLQVGVIFCVILVPILLFITFAFTFLLIGLKIQIKNNNFWDAIANCEIINNYYIH